MKSKSIWVTGIILGAVGVVLFSNLEINAAAGSHPVFTPSPGAGIPDAFTPSTSSAPISPTAVQQGLSSVVAAVRPSVVRISSPLDKGVNPNHAGMQFLDPFYSGSSWIGSGVIVHPEGYILTSRQVTGDIPLAHIALFRAGKRTVPAHRIASDHQSDLVLLKLSQGNNYPFAVLEDSSRVRVGDLVVAMGSPFGLSETVTHGIVSTSERDVVIENRNFRNVIQTDAAINRGNAGGPLVNIYSKIIGINIAIYSTDANFAGIGFAISSQSARLLLDRVLGNQP